MLSPYKDEMWVCQLTTKRETTKWRVQLQTTLSDDCHVNKTLAKGMFVVIRRLGQRASKS